MIYTIICKLIETVGMTHGYGLCCFFAGQGCLRANNANGLPPFMDYRNSDLRSNLIPELHQVIIPSYRFTCCGNITEWGVDLHPAGGQHQMDYTLDLQVWRPTPTVETTGCYSLVGSNRFTSVSLVNQVAVVTPLPQDTIEFQPGDVLGFYVENADGNDGGVVILSDSGEQGDDGYETEEVWYADVSNAVIGDGNCPYPVGTSGVLNTFTNAAPVISVSNGKLVPAYFCYIHINYRSTHASLLYRYH